MLGYVHLFFYSPRQAVEAIPDLRDLALETVGHRVVQPWGPWKKGDPNGVS